MHWEDWKAGGKMTGGVRETIDGFDRYFETQGAGAGGNRIGIPEQRKRRNGGGAAVAPCLERDLDPDACRIAHCECQRRGAPIRVGRH